MKLTILSKDGICFKEGEVFKVYDEDDYPYIRDLDGDEDSVYPLSDLILDGIEFKVTKD